MDINILDLVGYIVGVIIICMILPKDYTEELGGLIGLFILAIFTVVWLILFVFIDYNLVDIFGGQTPLIEFSL